MQKMMFWTGHQINLIQYGVLARLALDSSLAAQDNLRVEWQMGGSELSPLLVSLQTDLH